MLAIFRTRAAFLPRLTQLRSNSTLKSYSYLVPKLAVPCTANSNCSKHPVASLSNQHPLKTCSLWRSYAHVSAADMSQDKVTERVMNVIKVFEKINADKLTMESHFMKELGLDSLDHVELLMAVEDEFGFEIPDQEAEKLNKPVDIIKYLCQKLEIQYQ